MTKDLTSDSPNSLEKPTLVEKTSFMFSWLFFLIAMVVFLLGCYAAYSRLSNMSQVKVLLDSKNLSNIRQQQVSEKLKGLVKGNFFTADLQIIEHQVSLLDWVHSATVTRQWPEGIRVVITPKKAVTRFGSDRLLSYDGSIYQAEDIHHEAYNNLPLLYAPKDKTLVVMKQYNQLNQWFSNSQIQLVELSLTEQMTWFLKFSNGLRVIVDKNNTQKKLFQLSKVLDKQLKPLSKEIKYIDLRYRNGMAVAWKNGQPDKLNSYLTSRK